MKRTITALALTATLAGGFGVAALPASGAVADSAPKAAQSDRPTLDQARQQLREHTGSDRVAVVDGTHPDTGEPMYYGAALGEGTITFVEHDGTRWGLDDTVPILETVHGSEPATVSGDLVDGVGKAVFVVKGGFTGNGTGNALTFGYGPEIGWGAYVGRGPELYPSGEGYTELGEPGMEVDVEIDDGVLVTSSLWGPDYDNSNAEQVADPIVRTWTGNDAYVLGMRSESGGPFD